MTKQVSTKPAAENDPAETSKNEKKERLAKALRDNLRRRKAPASAQDNE